MLWTSRQARVAAYAVMYSFLWPWGSLVLGGVVIAAAAVGALRLLVSDRRALLWLGGDIRSIRGRSTCCFTRPRPFATRCRSSFRWHILAACAIDWTGRRAAGGRGCGAGRRAVRPRVQPPPASTGASSRRRSSRSASSARAREGCRSGCTQSSGEQPNGIRPEPISCEPVTAANGWRWWSVGRRSLTARLRSSPIRAGPISPCSIPMRATSRRLTGGRFRSCPTSAASGPETPTGMSCVLRAGCSTRDGRFPPKSAAWPRATPSDLISHPSVAWVRARSQPSLLMIGGRNLDSAPGQVTLGRGDTVIDSWEVRPGFFFRLIPLPPLDGQGYVPIGGAGVECPERRSGLARTIRRAAARGPDGRIPGRMAGARIQSDHRPIVAVDERARRPLGSPRRARRDAYPDRRIAPALLRFRA